MVEARQAFLLLVCVLFALSMAREFAVLDQITSAIVEAVLPNGSITEESLEAVLPNDSIIEAVTQSPLVEAVTHSPSTSATLMPTTHSPTIPPKLRIAVLVPVLTTTETTIAQLPIFTYLLPSFARTAEFDTYEYAFLFGADVGDALFDNASMRTLIHEKFNEMFNNLLVTLQIFTSQGNKGAPCWIWNELAAAAYNQSFDYFYQVNDDLELITPKWTSRFVDTLKTTNNIGVVGPLDSFNIKILTQSFVHRSHYDIFHTYYPKAFRNWYSDDWITNVYTDGEMHRLHDVVVRNGGAGQRYTSDDASHILAPHVQRGREQIQAYKAEHRAGTTGGFWGRLLR